MITRLGIIGHFEPGCTGSVSGDVERAVSFRPMCGRYTLLSKARSVAAHFELDELPDLEARYNIAPTQDVAVIGLNREGERVLGTMRWGFPRRRGGSQINLRNDTAVKVPRFRNLLTHRRCLVVADGWYEWQVQPDGSRLPHYIRVPGGGPFGFAGVWNHTPDGLACAILTCPASGPIAPIHDRMPVITPPPYERWLDSARQDLEGLDSQLETFAGELELFPVTTRVGNYREDDEALIIPVSTTDPGTL